MTDIFISYASEDRARAAQVAALLEAEGWDVWWDRRIPAGRTWRSVLEEAVEGARAMVVLWSEHSVKSQWVAEEAEEGRRLGRVLVPAMIHRVEPPIGFRAIQAADLVNWDGSPEHPGARMFVSDLKSLVPINKETETSAVPVPNVAPPQPPPEPHPDIPRWISLHWRKGALVAGVIALLLVGRTAWRNFQSTPRVAALPEQEQPTLAAPPRLTNLSVQADRKILKTEETLKLSATGSYTDGSQSDVSDRVEWTSTNMRVATVDEYGEVKALQSGSTNIIARIGDVKSSEWTLGVEAAKPAPKPVVAPKLVALNVTSSKQELIESERIALRAKGRYSDNSEKYLSSGVEWEISDRTVASLSDRGELIARRPGKIRVVARSDELSSE
ncbi:MAG TPA: TIR domain-containing protein, partial [Candidatus Binatia bacterium]|nr:TIR domain-containing protein [Candidatus Binatia bacterium]